jgi:hypothetical protein
MKRILFILSIIVVVAWAGWSDEQNSGPVKVLLGIQGGTELAYNIDYSAFGITNFLRKIGLWVEFMNTDEGFLQVPPDVKSDLPMLSINIRGFKFALSTFGNDTSGMLPLGGSTSSGATANYQLSLDGIEVMLFWKDFYWGVLGSQYYTRLDFNYADTNQQNEGNSTNSAEPTLRPLLSYEENLSVCPGLFQPDSTQWDNSPINYALTPTYYTLKFAAPTIITDRESYDTTPMTGTSLDVNPYATHTSGVAWFGYLSPMLTVDVKVGSQSAGFDLLSREEAVNSTNAVSGLVTVLAKPIDSLYLKASAMGGANYEQPPTGSGNPYGAGCVASYAFGLSDTMYLVPVLGFDYVFKYNPTRGLFEDLYEGTGGLKFLWGGITPAGKNSFNSQDTLRGLSAVAMYDNTGDLQLQFALYEPASRRSLIPWLGMEAFGEIKNLLWDPDTNGGGLLWGVGARAEYLISSLNLRPYVYAHFKHNAPSATTAPLPNSGQFVTRAGVRFEGIKNLSIDLFYAMARLNTDSQSIGNVALDFYFTY